MHIVKGHLEVQTKLHDRGTYLPRQVFCTDYGVELLQLIVIDLINHNSEVPTK
jgi:hypothetical protein